MAGGGINLTIETRDAFTTLELDDGGAADTIPDFFEGEAFFKTPTIVATTATVDVNQDREGFLTDAEDSTTQDLGATIAATVSANVVFDVDGVAYAITDPETNFIEVVFSDGASLGGITTFEGLGYATAPDRITMTAGFSSTARALTITVTGSDTIDTRTVVATTRVSITQPDASVSIFIIGVAQTISVWDLNGCVLVAHWVQGNTDAPGVAGAGVFKSRLYIANHTSSIGAVDVQVIEHDLSVGGAVGADLGTTTTASLQAGGALLIRMEDVLDALGVTLPHLVNGGNLAAVVTVRVSDCSGSYQTFDETTIESFFGTANMTRIQ